MLARSSAASAALLLVSWSVHAQESRPVSQPARARPIVISATKSARDPFELPYGSTPLTGERMLGERLSRSTPEALKEVPGVSVQKTAHGQGSPKIRGQTGFQTLLLVDGIRMNDAAWRSGNVEYWNQVDPYSLERFEIVRGPGSVLWGSDASFGVGQGFTKSRQTFADGYHQSFGALLRYGSAEHSYVGHVEHDGNVSEIGWHAGLSYRDYGDLTAGRDVGNLGYVGYEDRDADVKLTWRGSDHERVSVAAQVVTLDDVPRTHSTIFAKSWRGTQVGTDLKREADHRRQLYYAQYEADGLLSTDMARFTVGWKKRDEREARTQSNGRTQYNVTDVGTLFAIANAEKKTGIGTWSIGGDYYRDSVDSDFREFNSDGSLRSTRNRGPVAGDASYDLFGLYAQDESELAKNLRLSAGVRFTYAAVDAKDVDVPGDSVTFDNVSDSWTAFTPSARLLYAATPSTRFWLGFTEGFRTPNLSDVTRFDVGRSGEQEVPANGLDPEHYYTFELGARYDDGHYALEATPWYTIVRDQIGRFRTGNLVNGLPEVTKANLGDGWLAGFEVCGSMALTCVDLDEWRVFGFLDYVNGEVDAIGNSGQELNHEKVSGLPPLTGLLGARWENPNGRTGGELFSRMAYHKHPGSYSNDDRNDPQRVPPGGLPGYATLNLRGWHKISERFTASLAIENLTNVDYRILGSGLNEPGTNVIVTLSARF